MHDNAPRTTRADTNTNNNKYKTIAFMLLDSKVSAIVSQKILGGDGSRRAKTGQKTTTGGMCDNRRHEREIVRISCIRTKRKHKH